VRVPGPLVVVLEKLRAWTPVDRLELKAAVPPVTVSAPRVRSVAKLLVTVVNARLPPPLIAAGRACCVKAPPVTDNVRPAPMAKVPLLVKLGVVPDWATVRLPLATLMNPLLVWVALPRLMVKGWLVVTEP